MTRQPTPDLLAAGQRQPQEELTSMFGSAIHLDIAAIRIDAGTQPRARLDDSTVSDYAEQMRDGAKFPPVTVFHDGSAYYLADGFHRIAAARLNGAGHILADVRQGTVRDAILWSVGANAAHGLRRSLDDKRRAVLRLLEDTEWGAWSDREIARRTATTHPFVSKLRDALTGNVTSEKDRQYITKHGTQATMDTQRIGQPALAPQAVILSTMREWVQQWDDASDPLRSLLSGDKVVLDDFKSCLPAPATKPEIIAAAQRLLAEVKPAQAASEPETEPDDVDAALAGWLEARFANDAQRRQALKELVSAGPQNTRYWQGLQARLPEWATPRMVKEAASAAMQKSGLPMAEVFTNPAPVNGNGRPAPAPADLTLADLRAALLDLFTLPASASNREILEAAITAQSLARELVNA